MGSRCPPPARTAPSHLPAAQVQHEPPLLCPVLSSLPAPGLRVLDVEFEGRVSCQILKVAGHPDLHTRAAVELHGDFHLEGEKSKPMALKPLLPPLSSPPALPKHFLESSHERGTPPGDLRDTPPICVLPSGKPSFTPSPRHPVLSPHPPMSPPCWRRSSPA